MNRLPALPALCALSLAVATQSLHAAQWRTSAGITPGLTYTDNVCLSHENEKGEWIGLVTPDVGLSASGNHANLSLAASMQFNTLSDSKLEDLGCNAGGIGNRRQFAPRLRATGDVDVIDDWLYFDANATVDQNEINPFVSSGNDGLDRTSNTNTTVHYRVSPYIQHRFDEVANLYLRYGFDDEYNSENVIGDSKRETAQLIIGNSPEYWRLLWGVQASYDNIDYAQTNDRAAQSSQLTSYQGNLGYQLSRSWQINGYYGQENNDFISYSNDIDGTFWDVGVRWTPNVRTTVDVGTGERFFGKAPRMAISYRHKRSVLNASYRRSLTYDRNIRLRQDFLPFQDEFGQPVDPSTGLPVDLSGNLTTPSSSPILDELFTLGYGYRGRRNTLRLSASHSNQTRQQDNQESTFVRASASLSHTLSQHTSVTGLVSWNQQKPRTGDTELVYKSETWIFSLTGQRQLGEHLNMSLIYRFTDRQSQQVQNEYTENRVTLTFRYAF